MTRINAGVNPMKLSRQHLLAEHREIKRIPNMVRQGRVNLNGIPEKFCLGTGHVKFFYNKLGYLLERYTAILTECRRRGYNVTNYAHAWDGIPDNLMGSWEPTREDYDLVMARIKERS